MELEQVECPVCGPSKTVTWLNKKKAVKYVRCISCGTVYASPRLSRNVRYSNIDTGWGYSQNLISVEASRRPALKMDAEFIQRHIQGGKILDVGCSSGDFFDFFHQSSWDRYGVEMSASAAAFAAKAYNAQVVAGNLHSANWPSGFFDLVTMIDMFNYVDDPNAELREVKRILQPNGILAIEFPGQSYLFARSRGLISLLMDGRWCRLNPESHLYWYNPNSLHKLLENHGLRTISWYVVPSPVRSNRVANLISTMYYRLFSSLAGRSLNILNWAPKYICLAHRMEDATA